MPDLKTTNAGHAKLAAKRHKVSGNSTAPVSGNTWHWINGIAEGIGHFFSGTLVNFAKVVLNHLQNIVGAFADFYERLVRIEAWLTFLVWHVVRGWIESLRRHTTAQVHHTRAYLIRLLYVVSNQVLAVALGWVRRERRQRIWDVNRSRAQAKAEVRAMHQLIEREAASGYLVGQDGRLSLINHLLDFAVAREPLLRDVVGKISGILLDLLSVDDPVIRLLAGFLINHVIDRLGIDKLVGTAAKDMLEPLLGQPKPHDLHDVVIDMSKRMLNSEAQWTQFYTNGGSEVEQAGEFWRDITGPLGTAAIVAFTVQAITDPDAWGRELSGTIGKVANDVLDEAARVFKGV